MEMQEVTRPSKKENKVINVNLKITNEVSDFMKKNQLSPTLIFDKTIKELMEKNERKTE